MSVVLEDIRALRRGANDPITVGELPYHVAKMLNLRNHCVYLSSSSLQHINRKHKDIEDFDLLNLTQGIRRGLIIQERAKPHILIVNYFEALGGRRYAISLKVTNGAGEVWVNSMYRCKERQTRAHLRRGKILKNHT